jgi:hypothetical protein
MNRIFNSAHPNGNVVFNFTSGPIGDLTAFALGYRKAGHTLAANMAKARGYADYDGYPILFLYRHALELYLKAIVYRGAMLVRLISQEVVDTDRLFERHDLARLLPAIEAIFRQMNWEFNGAGFASFDEFASFVEYLDSIDPGSYAFRYPINRTGQAQLPRHFTVNVLEFAHVMDGLLGLLDEAATGIDEDWQAEAEARYELRQLAAEWRGDN